MSNVLTLTLPANPSSLRSALRHERGSCPTVLHFLETIRYRLLELRLRSLAPSGRTRAPNRRALTDLLAGGKCPRAGVLSRYAVRRLYSREAPARCRSCGKSTA